MKLPHRIAALVACVWLAGCATGKTIWDTDDIRDDGSTNIVFLTYEVEAYVTEADRPVDDIKLDFRCPTGRNPLIGSTCFSLKIPFRGTKEVDGFGLYAFEQTEAKAMKMKYGRYVLDSIAHSVVVERVPITSCSYSEDEEEEICSTTMQDESESHRVQLPSPVTISVSPGSGCYLGHLEMTMVDDELRDFTLDADASLNDEKLSTCSADLTASVLRFVDRPCT